MVGPRRLTSELKQEYNFQENRTHFSLVVPYNAKDSAFEARWESGICCRKSLAHANLFSISQVITSESVRARIDVLLYNSETNWVLADLYLACNFPLTTTSKLAVKYFWRLRDKAEYWICDHLPPVCYPNGTVTALAVKVESVPSLEPSWLTLRDQACKPVYSDDRFAYFSFSVDSCGTTRKVSWHCFLGKRFLVEVLFLKSIWVGFFSF